MTVSRFAVCSAAIGLAATVSAAPPNTIRAIYTKIPKHPSAVVPGARGSGAVPVIAFFRSIESLAVSPDGSQWCLLGRTTQDVNSNIVMLLGSGDHGAVLCQQGQPFQGGTGGEQYFFFQAPNPASWNAAGQMVFTARARNGSAATAQKVVRVDGGVHTIIHQQGDPALGLIDDPAGASGDETFGQTFSSLFLFNNGTASFRNGPINNCANSRWPAIFHGNTSFRQSGVSLIGSETWDHFIAEGAGGTPDGAHWFAAGAVSSPDTFTDDILVVDDQIVLRESSPVGPAAAPLYHVLFTRMTGNGDWLARGDDYFEGHWAVRNGVPIAGTGAPIAVGESETWGSWIYAANGNRRSRWVVMGNTTSSNGAADEVIVLNGRQVVVREGDPVDLDGDGLTDDAFIGRGDNSLRAFTNENCFLTDDMVLYFIATLHNAAGQDLNTRPVFGPPTALLRVQLPCPSDINGDGFVDGIDYDTFFNLFDAGNPAADYNSDGFVDGIDADTFTNDFEAGC